jgi:hypothetical protein
MITKFCNERWILILCYIRDIFEKVNDLNSLRQGKNSNILTMSDMISDILKKQTLWKYKYETGSSEMFQTSANSPSPLILITDSCCYTTLTTTVLISFTNINIKRQTLNEMTVK